MPIPHISEIPFDTVTALADGHPVFLVRGGRPPFPAYVFKQETVMTTAVDDDGTMHYGSYTTAPIGVKRNVQKAKEDGKRSYAFVAKAYAACLAHFPETRTLDTFEVVKLLNVLGAKNHDGSLFDDDFIDASKQDIDFTKTIWVAIDCLSGLYDVIGMGKHKDDDPSVTRILAYVAGAPDVTRELGRVLALDAFFHNHDRAVFHRDPTEWMVGNEGNFFLCRNRPNTDAVHFLGIDFWDPTSIHRNLYRDFRAMNAKAAYPWAGELLKSGRKMAVKTGLKKVLDELNDYLEGEGLRKMFFKEHVDECAKGWQDGAKRLKKFLSKEKNKPPSIKARKSALHW